LTRELFVTAVFIVADVVNYTDMKLCTDVNIYTMI